jgi:chemotaxis protein CheC
MSLSPSIESRLRVLCERCMTRAAEALGRMLGRPIRLTVATVASVPPEAIPALAGERGGEPLAAMQFEITGEEGGCLLIVFPLSSVHRLLQSLMPGVAAVGELSAAEYSAVQEVGNILASSFLSELADLFGRRLLHTPPQIHLEEVDELIGDLVRSLGRTGSELVAVQAMFEDPEERIRGRFLVFPEMRSVERLVQAEGGALR